MSAEIVQAVYRPKPDQAEAFEALLARHQPVLRSRGLVTDRPAVCMRSSRDGTYVEVFEWIDAKAAGRAHEDAAVLEVWEAMAGVADFLTLADLPEATTRFAHFKPVTLAEPSS